jgi:nucleoside-diphosphate-sugar epimerase
MSTMDTHEHLPEPGITVVTGAGGWFGRAYLSALAGDRPGTGPAARVGEVRALVHDPAEVPLVLASLPRAQVHVGSVTDQATMDRLFVDCAGASVVHAAGVIHPRVPGDFTAVNVDGTRAVLAHAASAGARRLVHLSSNSPFGFNPSPSDVFRHDEPYRPWLGYGESKRDGELAVLQAHLTSGLETVVVRPPWFYGPFQPERQTTFFRMVRRGRFPALGDLTQRRSMVHVDNLVQGVALAEHVVGAGGQAFWVADERPYPLSEILDTVKAALAAAGLDVARRQLVLPAVVGRIAQRVDATLQARGRYSQEFHVLGEMGETIAVDISRTRELLGYAPQVDLAAGMASAVRWCLDQGYEI